MGQKDINYSQLIGYLERRGISPKDAIEIIQKSTPEAQEDNKRFNWKMLRFAMFLWKRVEQDKNGNLLTKNATAKAVVESKNYKDMYQAFHVHFRPTKFDPKKEAHNLFKLITDPRQKHFFKSRFFVYERTKNNIPQDRIDYLMQFPKNP